MASVKNQCNINGGCEFCVGLAEKVKLRKDGCVVLLGCEVFSITKNFLCYNCRADLRL